MPKRIQRYKYAKTKVLEELREKAKIKVQQMAEFFGMNRNTVRDWELGNQSPHTKRRSRLIVYLLKKLKLKDDYQTFLQVWNDVMVEEWVWEPLSKIELWEHIPNKVKEITPDKPTAPPFLAPPPPPHDLVGRDDILKNLKQRLLAGGTLALFALKGLPGVGKTALAVTLAYDHEVLEHFRDGVLWAGLGRQGNAFALLGSWASALDISPEEITKLTTVEARAKAVHAQIGLRRMLLVVDDAWESEVALAFKVGGANCAHLVTTRIPEVAVYFAGQGVTVVPELSEEDGRALLERLAPAVTAAEPEVATTMVRAVGGLPLGLILIGNYLHIQALSGQPRRIEAALSRLRQVEERLQLPQPQSPLESQPSLPLGAPISLQAIIAISYEALDDPSRHAFRALSVFSPKPNHFSEEAALAVANAPLTALDTLMDYGLLEGSGPGRYTLHQTIADYARVLLGSDREPTRRHAEFYLGFMREPSHSWQMIETELAQIQQAWQALDRLVNEQQVLDYVYAIEDFQNKRGLWRDKIAWCERGLTAARALGRSQDEGLLLNQIGWYYRGLGAVRKALEYYERALAIRRSINDRAGEAETLNEIGIIYNDLGELDHALELLEEALSIRRELGDHAKEAQSLNNIGILHQDLGQFLRSLTYFEQALDIHHNKIQDLSGQAWVYSNIARTYTELGEYHKAHEALEHALQISRSLGDLGEELSILNGIGAFYRQLGEPRKALEYYEQSLSLSQKLGARRREAIAIHNIGVAHLDLDDPKQALAYLEQALPIRREIEDRHGEAFTLGSIGWAYYLLKMPHESINILEQALSIFCDVHDQVGEAMILNRLGRIYAAIGDLDRAEACFQQILAIHRLTPHPANEADTLYQIAMLRETQGKVDEAKQCLTQAIKIDEAINSPKLERDRTALAQLKEKRTS